MAQRPSFLKRQKEHARQEKQRMKAERKQNRKTEKLTSPDQPENATVESPEETDLPPGTSEQEEAGS